jgi:hypothetical protein
MSELKIELLSGIADFRSVLQDLDGCLARLVSAEDELQRELKRIPRFENWFEPRLLLARLRMLTSRGHLLPSMGRLFATGDIHLIDGE